jgi:AcrR family transcriptional regulator
MAADDRRSASPVTHRRGPATAKRAQVQADVLEATEQLLAEGHAYSELNVERIAKAAGISRTAFYFYFADKRDLLMRLAAEVSEQLYRQADVFFSGEGDPADQVREALTNVGALYQEHGILIRAIVEVSTYEQDIALFWRGLLEKFVDATQRRLEAEREREGRPGPHADARATAFALTWMVERTFYEQLVQHEPVDADELIDAMVRIYLGTL